MMNRDQDRVNEVDEEGYDDEKDEDDDEDDDQMVVDDLDGTRRSLLLSLFLPYPSPSYYRALTL